MNNKPAFDFDSRHVSAEWLTDEMRSRGYLEAGAISKIEQTPSALGTESPAEFFDVHVTYDAAAKGELPNQMLLKVCLSGYHPQFDVIAQNLSAHYLRPHSAMANLIHKEAIFFDALRDKKIKQSSQIPACYGTAISADGKANCVLIEDLRHTHALPMFPLPPSLEACEATVKTLAEIHASWWDDEIFGEPEFEQVDIDLIREVQTSLTQAFKGFSDHLGDRLSPNRRRLYEKVLDNFEALLARRFIETKSGFTLGHGDAHHWNFLLPQPNGVRQDTILFDWQSWHVDIGAHDLGFLMGVFWFRERRERFEEIMLRHYSEALQKQGVEFDWDRLAQDYQLSLIRHLFTPILLSSVTHPALWWAHLERIFASFEDWDCAALLD
ncbi:MAG: phosphotransferase [Pseudomonadota bacterium]